MSGEAYRYQIRTLRSIGDVQHRYMPEPRAFWERETHEFALVEAPHWLRMNPESGLIHGTPREEDVGVANVELVVRRRFDDEVGPDGKDGAVFQKTGAEFQASDTQRFSIRVSRP